MHARTKASKTLSICHRSADLQRIRPWSWDGPRLFKMWATASRRKPSRRCPNPCTWRRRCVSTWDRRHSRIIDRRGASKTYFAKMWNHWKTLRFLCRTARLPPPSQRQEGNGFDSCCSCFSFFLSCLVAIASVRWGILFENNSFCVSRRSQLWSVFCRWRCGVWRQVVTWQSAWFSCRVAGLKITWAI